MRSNRSRCAVRNSCVAGVCTFSRKATRKRVASADTGTVAVKTTSPNAARYWQKMVLNVPRLRPNLQSQASCLQTHLLRAVPSANRRCAGSVLITSRAGESSCRVLIARTGIAMTEARPDNAMHRTFEFDFQSDRTTSGCASHSVFNNSALQYTHCVCNTPPMTTHNRCDCFGRHDHTGQIPGDNLPGRR